MTSIELLIKNHKLIICAGSGGVGKTTMSAAIAVEAARQGLKVLVLTIDPAKRLATTLGLESLPPEPIRVPNQNFKGELWAGVVDAQRVFDRFVSQYVGSDHERDQILKNRLYKQLTTNLAGSQEYTALEMLYEAHTGGQYQLVVLDTPPAQHAIDFLRAPQKMYSLFQSSVVKWFLPPTGAKSGIRALFDRSTTAVFHALESLTGSDFLEELRQFFLVIKNLQPIIQSHSAEIHRVLTSSASTFVVVTSFDEIKIAEARVFRKALMATGYNLSMVIINRAFPIWMGKEIPSETTTNKQLKLLHEFYLQLIEYYTRHQKAFDQFAGEVVNDADVIRIPDFSQDIDDLGHLAKVSDELLARSEKGAS